MIHVRTRSTIPMHRAMAGKQMMMGDGQREKNSDNTAGWQQPSSVTPYRANTPSLGSRLVHKLFPGPVQKRKLIPCSLSALWLPVRSATGYRTSWTSWYKTLKTIWWIKWSFHQTRLKYFLGFRIDYWSWSPENISALSDIFIILSTTSFLQSQYQSCLYNFFIYF